MTEELRQELLAVAEKMRALHPDERVEAMDLLARTADFCTHCDGDGLFGCSCQRDE